MQMLWEAYGSLVALRRSGMGLHPLTWSDIKAWAELSGVNPTPWEVETLLLIEAAVMSEQNELALKRERKARARARR